MRQAIVALLAAPFIIGAGFGILIFCWSLFITQGTALHILSSSALVAATYGIAASFIMFVSTLVCALPVYFILHSILKERLNTHWRWYVLAGAGIGFILGATLNVQGDSNLVRLISGGYGVICGILGALNGYVSWRLLMSSQRNKKGSA